MQVSATCTDNVVVAGLGLGMLLLYSGPRDIPETLVFRNHVDSHYQRIVPVVWLPGRPS